MLQAQLSRRPGFARNDIDMYAHMYACSFMLLLVLFAFFCTSSLAFEAAVTDGSIIVSGKSSPDESLPFAASFQMQLPVEAGQYEYETSITVPQKPNSFAIKVQNIKDLNAGVKMGIWLTKRFEASGGTATLSQSNIPPGSYNLKIFGQALEASSSVSVEVTAETEVKADENGDYSLAIETAGMPGGEYLIRGAGQTKSVQVNAATITSPTTGASIPPSPLLQASSPVEITGDVLTWYASLIGKDASNVTELAETETLLKNRLKGGYWKIVSQGEPLTEQAGDCLQKYCLVRGTGACSSCRQKDQILKNGKSSPPRPLHLRNESNSPSQTQPQIDNLIARLLDWLSGLISGGRIP